jgi:formylglycine-generating enzyme required for sulfatase activity
MATRLLAGLHTDDCSWVVNWVAEVNPEVAAECIVLSGAALALDTKKRVRKEWRARLKDSARDPDPRARAAVGRALGLTGWDNREGVGTVKVEVEGQTIRLPDLETAWVDIPAGEFICGHKDEDDNPPQKVYLPAFRISRYPVTYAQFQTFIDDPEGYQNQDRWFEGLTDDEDYRKLEDQYFRLEGRAYANDPRESVSWYQAVAFCRWLSWRLGGEYELDRIDQWKVRLPTEQEWERAARGRDGRIYPYGDEYDPAKGNTVDTGIDRTCAVGIFPHASSPDGVMDMSGNVWDWCLTTVENNQTALAVPDPTTWDTPLRGGSWYGLRVLARAVFRYDVHPYFRSYDFGFRVVSVVRPPS